MGLIFIFARDHLYLFWDRSSARVSCCSVAAAGEVWMRCAYQGFVPGYFMVPLSKGKFTPEHCAGPESE